MKNWREKKAFEFLFYLNWRNFVPCLRTRLRDQIHRSSLPKMFLFLLVDFKFENWNFEEWEIEASRAWDFKKKWGLISYFEKKSSMINFHWNLIKKIKRKCKGVLTPIFSGKWFSSDVVQVFWKIDFFFLV